MLMCPSRTIHCPLCWDEIRAASEIAALHRHFNSVCKRYVLECKACGISVSRAELIKHRTQCEKQDLALSARPSDYELVCSTCYQVVLRSELDLHNASHNFHFWQSKWKKLPLASCPRRVLAMSKAASAGISLKAIPELDQQRRRKLILIVAACSAILIGSVVAMLVR